MKATAVFMIIALCGVGAAVYLVVEQRAERARWQTEAGRLNDRIAELEQLAEQRREAPSRQDLGDEQAGKLDDARARLGKIEARILDTTAKLAQLESDRVVAEDRAAAALRNLRQQVRTFVEIEEDLTALDTRRRDLQKQIAGAEWQRDRAADDIAARQKQARALEQDIARLALRRETMIARAQVAEQRSSVEPTMAAAPKPPEPTRPPVIRAANAVDQALIVEPDGIGADQDRTKGLYRFEQLRVDRTDQLSADGDAADPDDRQDGSTGGASDRATTDAWAEKQYLMGLTLLTTGEQSSGTRELNEAILAFKAVLGEWPRDRDPMRWAIIRNDLGYALALLGQRQSDVATLEAAALACRDALAEFRRDDSPILWATAQRNLGVTLSGIAAIKNDETLWRRAIEALQQAVEVFQDAGAEAEAERADRRLRDAHHNLTAQRRRAS